MEINILKDTMIERQLVEMASDKEIQAELRIIDNEFVGTSLYPLYSVPGYPQFSATG